MVSRSKALLAFIYFMTSSSYATAEIIELGSSKKVLEFKRHIEETPGLKSLNKAYLKREFKKTEGVLKSKYELAVKGLLLEDLKPSTFVFKEIVSWPKKSFLTPKAAQIVLQSHMRLAHLNQENSRFWLKHALFFDPDYSPEAGLFNPDVMSSLKNQKTKQNPYLYLLSKNDVSDDETLLFVNGVAVLNSTKVHPSGQYQFTFLKDGFEKLDVKVSGEDIAKLEPVKLKPLDLGTCKSPKFQSRFGIQIEKIYFSKDCIRSLQEAQNQTIAKKRIEAPKIQYAAESKKEQTHNKRVNFFERKTTWYAIGAAVAAGTLVAIFSNQNGDPRIIPVER